MRIAVRLGLAATALMFASPALASDFSGVGRFVLWGLVAFGVMVAVKMMLTARNGRAGTFEGNAAIATIAGIMFAPAVAWRNDDQWVFAPFPDSALAMDGSLPALFPVSLLSIAVCSADFTMWPRRRSFANPGPDDTP